MSQKSDETRRRTPPEPMEGDLRLPNYEIIVIWYSGSFEDRPAVMSIKEFCQHWCPKKFAREQDMR